MFEMNRGAVATSGDYRNFFRNEDGIFGHIIDPATGYPALHGAVSATVIADTCALADALATALVAMEISQALQMINGLDNVEALIIHLTPKGEYLMHRSKGFYEKPRPGGLNGGIHRGGRAIHGRIGDLLRSGDRNPLRQRRIKIPTA
jgi:hypothetical protein